MNHRSSITALSLTGFALTMLFSLGAYHAQNKSPGAKTKSIQRPVPHPTPKLAEDTTRYVGWLTQHDIQITDADTPHEELPLRAGEWGFFYLYHEGPPRSRWDTPIRNRVALDRLGHAVTSEENGRSWVVKGDDWYALLSGNKLDANGVLTRVAWLFNNAAVSRSNGPTHPNPILTIKDGVITFRGWWEVSSDPPYQQRVTIIATKDEAKLVRGAGDNP